MMREHQEQLSLGRTVRITLKRAGTYSSTSDTSSPSGRSVPPQSGRLVLSERPFRSHVLVQPVADGAQASLPPRSPPPQPLRG
jgi:hypothetical protein